MSMRLLETGIKAIQQGRLVEGARFIRIALRGDELPPATAAVAWLWLAETTDDPAQKRACYNAALDANPASPEARQRLTALLAAQAAPASMPDAVPEASTFFQPVAQPQQRATPAEQVVRVIGGPNGPGTAFFAAPNGLLVTTRYVLGGLERVTIELRQQRQVLGQVVRAWPDLDVALVQIDEQVGELLPITPYPQVANDTPLLALTGGGQQLRGQQRPTNRALASHWIPTGFVKLADAGGNALFDNQNYLVGMLTRNTARNSGYVFGVHIAALRRCIEQYQAEIGAGERRAYCPGCGSLSRATGAGYFFCEVCGGLSPHMRNAHRFPQGEPFAEMGLPVCMHCGAQVGFHQGRCLRCGQPSPA